MDTDLYNEKLFESIRIGNIESRWSEVNKKFEIVKWFPNIYYGKSKQEYPNCDDSCFRHPESCVVVAFFDLYHKYEPDIRSVCSRIFDLTEEEFRCFKEVGNQAWDKYMDVRSDKLEEYLINKARESHGYQADS